MLECLFSFAFEVGLFGAGSAASIELGLSGSGSGLSVELELIG